MIFIYTFLIAFLLSLVLSPMTINISKRLNVFSKPNKTKAETKPCLGGIGIYIAFICGSILLYFLDPGHSDKLTGLLFSSLFIFLLGLVDDARELRPYEKIIAQLVAIGFLMMFGMSTKITFLPIGLNLVITFVWILLITNAFNLLDIVDGLTSGLVIIISSTLLIISLVNDDFFSSMILIAMIGSHLGFLKYNYPPARLYMGDTGSLFSGFLLAAIAINISYAPPERPVALVTPVLAMSLPIYDTLFLIIVRTRKKKPVFSKTNDHFALRLATMGYSVHKSIWTMYLFSIFLAVASLMVAFGSNLIGIIALFIVVLVFIAMGKKIGMVKVDD